MGSRSKFELIYVNARFATREVTGVERYSHEVTGSLANRVQSITPGHPLPGVGGHLWEQVILPQMVGHKALLWSPANTGPLMVRNQVVTIHDLSVIEHPEWFNRQYAAWYACLLPRLARRARMIITVSEFSRLRIIDTLHLPPHKIAFVSCGVDAGYFSPQPQGVRENIKAKYNLPARYILFVGSISPRKNLKRLLEAWQRIAGRYPHHGLVIAGARRPTLGTVALGGRGKQVHWLGYVENQDLPGLYSAAQLYVLPSLYEGFGLPVLEAMACGTPVITSRAGALPEVAGEAALLVDPDDPAELAQSISQVLDDIDLRASLIESGRERASRYSWKETAEGVWRVLESVGEYVC